MVTYFEKSLYSQMINMLESGIVLSTSFGVSVSYASGEFFIDCETINVVTIPRDYSSHVFKMANKFLEYANDNHLKVKNSSELVCNFKKLTTYAIIGDTTVDVSSLDKTVSYFDFMADSLLYTHRYSDHKHVVKYLSILKETVYAPLSKFNNYQCKGFAITKAILAVLYALLNIGGISSDNVMHINNLCEIYSRDVAEYQALIDAMPRKQGN